MKTRQRLTRRFATLTTLCLLSIASALRAQGAGGAETGDALIRRINDAHRGHWFTTLTFVQHTTYSGTDRPAETWYETMQRPGFLRVDVERDGRLVGRSIFRADSLYVTGPNGAVTGRPFVHDLLVLLHDVHVGDVDDVLRRLRGSGFDLSRLHESRWRDREVYVVGAAPGDSASKQFWVDAEELLVVRVRERLPNGALRDVEVGDIGDAGRGRIEREVRVMVNGRPTLHESYQEVTTGMAIPATAFDPTSTDVPEWVQRRRMQQLVAAELGRRLDSVLTRWAADPKHFGVTAAVRFPDGRVWRGAAGRAGRSTAMRTDHHVQVASIGKTMTAALILRLVDAGRLSLEDSIGGLLPAYRNVPPGITIRQLLNHTSGVTPFAGPEFEAEVRNNPARAWRGEDLLAFVPPPSFSPGTRTQYSSSGFVLLGLVAERMYGRPLSELYARELWRPLGLTSLCFPMAAPTGAVANALRPNGEIVAPLDRPVQVTVGQGAGGVFATAEAVASWGDALFRGRVLSASMQREMRALVDAAGNIPGETGAGLGIRAYRYLGRNQIGHSGGSPMGSSLLLHDPTTGITVAVLINQGAGAEHFALAPALLEIASKP